MNRILRFQPPCELKRGDVMYINSKGMEVDRDGKTIVRYAEAVSSRRIVWVPCRAIVRKGRRYMVKDETRCQHK